MNRTQWIATALVLLAAALVLWIAIRGRQPPVLPNDRTHERFVSAEDCQSCHGPQGSNPQPANHPLGFDCLRCHGMPTH